MTSKQQTKKLINLIEQSEKIVFFGGAGVSVASGIPDFRSKDGLYNQHDVQFEKYKPEYLLSHSCLAYEPKVFFEFYRQKLDTRTIEPNVTHKVLAGLEQSGKNIHIVTQNIDGLHQKAGSVKVHEIHGTTQRCYCAKCKKEFPADFIFENTDEIPRCECGGIVRPDVTLYEENLPEAAVNDATNALMAADLLIVAGTSLTVYPACTFLDYFQGENMVIINKEPVGRQPSLCFGTEDLFIQYDMSKVFEEVGETLL